ncbi:TIGR04222 domain-containing membrane protein, partial [Streptomyces sp. T-3]|nr:TIGR04222 domain-containing membrane protein [Streptomyces sp. T-3]
MEPQDGAGPRDFVGPQDGAGPEDEAGPVVSDAAATELLDIYEAALLVGGPEHAARVALIALHDEGAVTVETSPPSGKGQHQRLRPDTQLARLVPSDTPEGRHPVEHAVVRVLTGRGTATHFPALLGEVVDSPEVQGVIRQLVRRGLLKPPKKGAGSTTYEGVRRLEEARAHAPWAVDKSRSDRAERRASYAFEGLAARNLEQRLARAVDPVGVARRRTP